MNLLKNRKVLTGLAAFGLYLLSTGISFAAFNYFRTPPETISIVTPLPEEGGSGFRVDLSAPKTEVCPLNGEMFTKQERQIWEKRRPLGVMIENHEDSRPQSGISRADVVYEAVAEGGITRFLAIFLCRASALDVQVGPVRSARTHFIDFLSGYGNYPLYAHVGGANDFDGSGRTHPKVRALEQISSYGWKLYNDLDSMALSFPVYWRDEKRLGRPVAVEHTMYSTTDRLYEAAAERGLTDVDSEGKTWSEDFVSWQFKDDAKEDQRGDKSPEFSFWEGYSAYDVKWEYDKSSNNYQRINGGQKARDRNDDSFVEAKVVIVVFMIEKRSIDENKHLLYGTTGSGKAVIFQDGQAISGTWNKKEREDRMIFKDARGKSIEFNRGQIWIEVLPVGASLTY